MYLLPLTSPIQPHIVFLLDAVVILRKKETLNVERVCVATVCKSTGGISPEGNNMHVKKDLELTCWASINCLKGRQ